MPHPRRTATVLALTVALVAFPLGALASHQYADVPNTNPFHGDIAAITNAGVTSGCGGGNYCPDRNVTRAEMAAFMNRLGALAANKTPVVNADKVDGLDSTMIHWQRHYGVIDEFTTMSAHLGDATLTWNCATISITPGSGQTGAIWTPAATGSVGASPSMVITIPFVFTATTNDASGHPAVWQGMIHVGPPGESCGFELIGTWDLLTAVA